ncbi:DUF4269 domain-containing protein [Paenibacillus sp. MBLB4367]|uniref:DUF4269 domain-containing protein n=1 Tax=Paenibacillus sp. MBLB4367 TaxID=3384767 RepID=UPI003908430E
MEPDWSDITYLLAGNERQKNAYDVLESLALLRQLSAFTPLLAGTVPLDIDVPGSDLDIVCEVRDFDAFERLVRSLYGHLDGFACVRRTVDGIPRVKINFTAGEWPIELFGQPVPVTGQNGFRHMVVEHRLLQEHGEALKSAVRVLKTGGVKTEPAFARALGLTGDPYLTLLALYADNETNDPTRRNAE